MRIQRNVNRALVVLKEEGVQVFVKKTVRYLFKSRRLMKPYWLIKRWLVRRSRRLTTRFSDFYFAWSFIFSGAGREYGVTPFKKLWLLRRVKANCRAIPSLTTWQQHIVVAEAILRVPRSMKGDVVECGAFNGASTADLSLVCAMTDRRLFVCDSFEGLPAPEEGEKYTIMSGTKTYYCWQQGEYASEGGLSAVMDVVSRLGEIEVCRFVKGYFCDTLCDTLKDMDTDSIVLVFEDADLPSSVRDCIIYLWPRLREGCRFYCHEPWSAEVVGLFYDKHLWNSELGIDPPGFWGSGHGLGLGLGYTRIGYAEKVDLEEIIKHGQRQQPRGTKEYESQTKA